MSWYSPKSFWRRVWRVPDAPEQLLVILAALVGVVTGLGAIGFSELIALVERLCFEHLGHGLQATGVYWLLLPLLPMAGALLVGLITTLFAPEAEGHGVPEVMDAMARRNGRIRPRVAGAKAVASSLTIGSGGSAGTEGPIIQIGAALGSSVGQWLAGGRLAEMRVLIGCGAAAGIAAIFNAPIAGVLFAVEVLLRDVSLRSFLPIIIASVASSTVMQAVRGAADPIFPVPVEFLTNTPIYRFSVVELGNYAVLGVLCGLVAYAFIKLLYWSEDAFRKLPVHRVARPVLGALLLGLVAIAVTHFTDAARPHQIARAAPDGESAAAVAEREPMPAVFGNGYPIIGLSLEPAAYGGEGHGGAAWTVQILLVLLAAKIVATCCTLGSGGSGGVFAPSLFIGAAVGGAFGVALSGTGLFPELTPGAYALVGMAAVVAATIHAPLTATLMLFELTGDYEVIIPIMLAGVIGLQVARRLEPASIYTLKLLRRGVDLYGGQDINLLRHLHVRDAMRTDFAHVRPGDGVMEVVARFVEHPGMSVFVVEEDGALRGVIAGPESRSIIADAASFEPFLIAADLMEDADQHVISPDENLADVMRRMARFRGELPVVQDGRLLGVVWPQDVLERYNSELFKREMATSVASSMSYDRVAAPVPLLQNTSIAELVVPPRFIGQTLGDLDIRNRFGVTILLIRQHGPDGDEAVNALPSAQYVFRNGDVILVMGPDDKLRALERGYV